MDLTLRQLEVFATVARCGSFTGASERLHVAQSSLSRTVIAMERGLGVPLLERTTRRVRCTPEGEEVLVERVHGDPLGLSEGGWLSVYCQCVPGARHAREKEGHTMTISVAHSRNLIVMLTIALCAGTGAAAEEKPRVKPAADAIERGLAVVQTAARNYPRHRQCFSCHHQTLPLFAMA